MTALARRAPLLALALAGLLASAHAVPGAEEPPGTPRRLDEPAGPSPSAPAAPTDPADAEVARAIREARKEHETLKTELDREYRQLGEKVSEETQAVVALRDEERELRKRQADLLAEERSIEAKLAAAGETHRVSAEIRKAFQARLESLAAAFRSRVAWTLAALEEPRITEAASEALEASQPIGQRLQALLEAYDKLLTRSRSATVGGMALPVARAGGKVEKVNVLRLGLWGGVFSRPGWKEGGFVVPDADQKSGYTADSGGLSAGRKASLAQVVQKPDRGGVLPVDLTGAARVREMQSGAILSSWFTRGGPFLWPLLSIAAVLVVLIAERTVALAVRSFGLGRRMERVLAMVRAGRPEAAEAACSKMAGPAGAVLRAAMENRDEEKALLEGAVEEALLRSAPLFRARLGLISLCGAAAVLLGVLGTVGGLFGTFEALGATGLNDQGALASGLSEALVATEIGLLVALVSLVARGLLGAASERALDKIEAGGVSMVNAILKTREARLGVGEPA